MNTIIGFENNFYISSNNIIYFYELKYNTLKFKMKKIYESTINQIKLIEFQDDKCIYIVGIYKYK